METFIGLLVLPCLYRRDDVGIHKSQPQVNLCSVAREKFSKFYFKVVVQIYFSSISQNRELFIFVDRIVTTMFIIFI